MTKFKKLMKRFGTDIAGYSCLLLVIPVGLLPGPGGIPLLVAGLGLLSIHNPRAKKLLDYVKKHSESLRTIFFPKNTYIEWFWDIFALALFITAYAISAYVDITILKISATGLGAISTTIALFNRGRLDSLQRKFRKQR